jgi:nucleoside-diphosphate-sugar epimerase
MKIALFGATGFVGTTLAERLGRRADVELRLFSRGFGNAWRLARSGTTLETIDVLNPADVERAVSGCTHVVNCTRGGPDVMIKGLDILLRASRAARVQRFVHLSSVAVYGESPPPEAAHESGPARPEPGSYGAEKLLQDQMVQRAAEEGLSCVILCPPNISGVYSSFVCNVLADIRAGSFALVEGGRLALNVVDVENLAHAIELALVAPRADAQRIFVTDGEGLTWRDLAEALLPLSERDRPIDEVPAHLFRRSPEPPPKPSLFRSLKHLVSSDVREALRRDPLLARLDKGMRQLVAAAGGRIEDSLRHAIEGPIKVRQVPDRTPYTSRYNAMQLRNVHHHIDRARELLGYKPVLSFQASMARFRTWYEVTHGYGEDFWPLARALETFKVEPV